MAVFISHLRQVCDKMKIPIPRKRGETYTITVSYQSKRYGGVSKSMLTLNEAIIDVKEG